MSLVYDVTADQPPPKSPLAVQELTSEEVASLAEELVVYHQRFAPLFYRREQREWAAVYLRGLLTADVPRKNVEAMALRLLGVGPHAERQVRALQQFIGEGKWDDEALLAEHQRLVNETLGEEDGVLIIDGSDFPKHGQHSAGVAPQWCGNTGKKDNCQAGVFLGYASRKGATFLDRQLYLPASWFDEEHQALWQDCQIPDEVPFQTKHELAAQLVEGIMASGRLQARWVVCDEGYGDSPLSCNGWTQRDYGTWQRSREIPRSGHSWKRTDRRSGLVQAGGFPLKPAHAKALSPDESGCIPPVQPKCRWRSWPNSGRKMPGGASACSKDTKARWSRIFSCSARCCLSTVCLAQRCG